MVLKLDDPTELRRKRRLVAKASRRRKLKASAKWAAALGIVAVGSFIAAYIVRLALATPDPLSPHIAIVSLAGAFLGGIGSFTFYYLSSYSQNSLPKLAKGEWAESLAPGIVAYAFGVPCATLLAALLASETEFASITFVASILGSTAFFAVYWYLARPLIPARVSANQNSG